MARPLALAAALVAGWCIGGICAVGWACWRTVHPIAR